MPDALDEERRQEVDRLTTELERARDAWHAEVEKRRPLEELIERLDRIERKLDRALLD